MKLFVLYNVGFEKFHFFYWQQDSSGREKVTSGMTDEVDDATAARTEIMEKYIRGVSGFDAGGMIVIPYVEGEIQWERSVPVSEVSLKRVSLDEL